MRRAPEGRRSRAAALVLDRGTIFELRRRLRCGRGKLTHLRIGNRTLRFVRSAALSAAKHRLRVIKTSTARWETPHANNAKRECSTDRHV